MSALYPAKNNPDRLSNYFSYKDKLNFTGINFPVSLHEIPRFEKLNDISINVFQLHERKPIVSYVSRKKRSTHINLLLIEAVDDENPVNHYVYIKNLSRLLSNYRSNREKKCIFATHV